MQRRQLELLVADVASLLMGVDSTTVESAYRQIMRDIVEFFDIDACFLRHNDHAMRATYLVSEWPPRENVGDPDPLGVVYFADADPVFASTEFLTTIGIFRPGDQSPDYISRVTEATGVPATSLAAVPLVSKGQPTGVLGCLKHGDREWTDEELDALKVIATLFAQLQGRVAAEERLRFLAVHDDLTQLPNRSRFTEHLDTLLDTGADGLGEVGRAVVYFDLDRLKSLNDFLGHVAGDEYLSAIADRLRERLGPDAYIARVGGDEFIAVLSGSYDLESAFAYASALRAAIAENVELSGQRVSRNASIGVAVGVPGRDKAAEVVAGAEQSAAQAKRLGGNQVVPYTAVMKAASAFRSDMELYLPTAIEEERLFLEFQPEVDLRTGRITAVEALVRWSHPTRGILGPRQFFPVADSANLATEIGLWVVDRACAGLTRWRSGPGPADLRMLLNISPDQLVMRGFTESVLAVMDRYALEPAALGFEVTEVAAVTDPSRTARALDALDAAGFSVAIDDFGTGYSSLLHARQFPFHALKIDRAFVRALGRNPDDSAVVNAIIDLADSLRMSVMAEGVESRLAARTLVKLGCYRAQGFLICRPVDEPTIVKYLRTGEPLISLAGP